MLRYKVREFFIQIFSFFSIIVSKIMEKLSYLFIQLKDNTARNFIPKQLYLKINYRTNFRRDVNRLESSHETAIAWSIKNKRRMFTLVKS